MGGRYDSRRIRIADCELLCHGCPPLRFFAMEHGPGRFGGTSACPDTRELSETATSRRSRPADIRPYEFATIGNSLGNYPAGDELRTRDLTSIPRNEPENHA